MVKHRDAYIKACGQEILVVTTDNAAGIGGAREDALAVEPYLVGHLTCRVALLEAVALGATPLAVSSTLSFDFASKQGQELTRGILDSMLELGLTQVDLTGSCETNFPTAITCLGITVLSLAHPHELLTGKVRAGDSCYLLGKPFVGQDVLSAYPSLPAPSTIGQIAGWPGIHEIIPVGSGGVEHKLTRLVEAYKLDFQQAPLVDFGWTQSAGPATCLLVIGSPNLSERLQQLGQAVTLLGHFY